MKVEAVSGEESVFEGEAAFVRARTVVGEIGILPGHAPLLAQLSPGEVKIRTKDGQENLLTITGGFMTVKEDRVIILAEVTAE